MNQNELEFYIKRTFELAQQGQRAVAPNPMVGAIIFKEGKILSEGYHQIFGGPHAEVHAIKKVSDADLKGSTLFVNLEPCCHFGKTPPCTNLIIEKGITRVVYANQDPNPNVAGKGSQQLINHNIMVTPNILAEQGRMINKRYFCFQEKKRPYIIIKFAQTHDAFIARSDYSSKWISSEKSRKLVHQWRHEEQAILVGTKTALIDNPSLTVRHIQGINPIRIAIDKDLKIPKKYNLLNSESASIIFNQIKDDQDNLTKYIKIDFNENLARTICDKLFNMGIASLILEGGSYTIQHFIDQNLWDEARIFTAKQLFGTGIKAPIIPGELKALEFIGEERLSFYENKK